MQRAQSLVEYGLFIATVALLVLLGAGVYGGVLADWFVRLAVRIVSTGL